MRLTVIRAWLALGAVIMVTGACASYTDETKEMRNAFRARGYEKSLELLDGSDLKEKSNNRLLYRLEKAMILDREGQRDTSRRLLIDADKIVDQLYTTSISKTAATFLYNDSASDYEGENFEKVAIHTIMALSYLKDDSLGEARVEARKINNRLKEINDALDDSKDHYNQDAFARYLSAMIYEAKGEVDDAIIDYAAALGIYEDSYRPLFGTPVPDDLVPALYRLLSKRSRTDRMRDLEKKYPKAVARAKKGAGHDGELIVIHQLGTIAIKTAKDFALPIADQIVRFSFPVIEQQSVDFYGNTGVTITGRGFVSGDLAQNMNAIAYSNLEDRRLRLIAKAGARLLIKGQITRQAEKNFGVVGWLAGNIYGAVTETADTRSWTLLPAAFKVTRVRLPPGSYDIDVQTNGRTERLEKIHIRPESIHFRVSNG